MRAAVIIASVFAIAGITTITTTNDAISKSPVVQSVSKPKSIDSKVTVKTQKALKKLRINITAARTQTWSCQDDLKSIGLMNKRTPAGTDVWSLPTSVPYRTWVLEYWLDLASKCSKNRQERTIPNIQDWPMAVQWVQKIYPGTSEWMLYISDREGGWGRWVWYGGRLWGGGHIGNDFLGADTVGGWMQFRFSTFAPYWRGAKEDLIRRGYFLPDFKVPPPGGDPLYKEWLNPMGQALTAGYMKYYGKEGCHWCL